MSFGFNMQGVMAKCYLMTFILLCLFNHASGQQSIRGSVLDKQSNKPIAYANIGIINSKIGTISNQDGTFSIEIPASHINDTLIFSALGYNRKSIRVRLLDTLNTNTILLNESPTILTELIVSSPKEKRKEFELGNRYSRGNLNLSSGEDANAGASVALLVENKYPSAHDDLTYPVFLQEAKVRIGNNTLGNFKIRVRLYEVDSLTGAPGKDFLNESLVIVSGIERGWISFDLSKYNLLVNGPFYIAFEWIMEEKDRDALKAMYRDFEKTYPERVKMDTTLVDGKKVAARHYINFLPGTSFGVSLLPFSLDNYKCFSRYNSFGAWTRAPYILTARVTVSNQK
jgi:hypothetical protein